MNNEVFEAIITEIHWNNVFQPGADLENAYNLLIDTLNHAIQSSTPIIKGKNKKKSMVNEVSCKIIKEKTQRLAQV